MYGNGLFREQDTKPLKVIFVGKIHENPSGRSSLSILVQQLATSGSVATSSHPPVWRQFPHTGGTVAFFQTGSRNRHVCGRFPDVYIHDHRYLKCFWRCCCASAYHQNTGGTQQTHCPLLSYPLLEDRLAPLAPRFNGFGSSWSFRFCTYAKPRVSRINWYLLVVERRQNEFATSFHSVLSAVITWDSQQWSAEAAVRYVQEQECDLLTCDPQKR